MLTVLGPTASGKTDLAIRLAQHYSAEIFSADSRQFYKELNIGVARPTEVELAAAVHHFIAHISIHGAYSSGDFEKEALELLGQYFEEHEVGVLVGGSGLFIKAVLEGLDYFPKVSEDLRARLNTRLESEGLEALVRELQALDPKANDIELDNPRRVLRALEVCLSSGKPYSSFKQQPKKQRPFHPVKIAINWDRQLLYDRINRRTELMFEQGLVDEVRSLLPHRNLNALNTVGYSEVFDYLDGHCSLEQAIDKVKQHTRNYAKRQLTWLRKQEDVLWVAPKENVTNIIERLV